MKHSIKRNVGLGIAAILLVAVGVTLAIMVNIRQTPGDSPNETASVGQPVDLDETPNYRACELTTEATIRSILQKGITALEPSSRAGAVSPNGTTAESCTYGVTTPQSDSNSLVVQVYPLSAEANNQGDTYDASWSLDIDADLPSYYKLVQNENDFKTGYYRVILGGQTVQWSFAQPIDGLQFTDTDIRYILFSLSKAADYDIVRDAAAQQLLQQEA